MSNKLVSIIVPVYKVEKYLDRCVNSLINQTLKDVEIILVDDGSPDKCPAMCDEWMKKDKRIKVIHKENGGLSSARNAGLIEANGDYVGFVDSDDDVELNMYERMYSIAEKYSTDFVMSDYKRILSDNGQYLKSLDIRQGYYSKDDIMQDIFPQLIMNSNIDYGPLLSVWHCLYNRKFLLNNNLYFDEEIRWSEDNIFSSFVGYKANSFYYLKNEGLYHYYQNPDTITTSYRKGSWHIYKKMNEKLKTYFSNINDYDFSNQLKYHIIYYACNSLGQITKSGESFANQVNMVKDIMKDPILEDAFLNLKLPKHWNIKLKIQIMFIKYRYAFLYRIMVLR